MRIVLYSICFLSVFACSSERYLLNGSDSEDKRFVTDYIRSLNKENKITRKPLLVIDGNEFPYESLSRSGIPLQKDDILNISFLNKKMEGPTLFSERGKNGVVLLTTKESQEKLPGSTLTSNVLFLLGDTEISQAEMEKINPDDIQSIEVIKNTSDVQKYSSGKNYDGVVIIHLKKH